MHNHNVSNTNFVMYCVLFETLAAERAMFDSFPQTQRGCFWPILSNGMAPSPDGIQGSNKECHQQNCTLNDEKHIRSSNFLSEENTKIIIIVKHVHTYYRKHVRIDIQTKIMLYH